MIPYIEVRDKYTKLQKSLIIPTDCFFELSYYGVGEFVVECKLDDTVLNSVRKGDFLTIPNKQYIFIINSLKPSYDTEKGYIMTLAGKQAKSILNQRVINNAKVLSTSLASAVNGLILDNAGANAGAERNMNIEVVSSSVNETIEETQATIGDLLEFTENLLKTKECGSELYIENNALKYRVYKGEDKSGFVVFSQGFDNLSNSEYLEDNTNEKTFILLESEGVFQSYNSDTNAKGLDRKEMFFESSVSTRYTNAQGQEVELVLTNTSDLATFKNFLVEDGKEQLTNFKVEKTFNGNIDTSLNQYEFGVDYYLGDKVKVQDEYLNIFITPRITKFTFSQNTTGYSELVEYGN